MNSPRSFRKCLSSLLLAASLLASARIANAETLPRLEADSMGGTHVVLPTDAAGKPLVILIAFTKESEGDLKHWTRKLLDDKILGSAAVYVVVVADKMAFFERRHVRKMVEGAAVGSHEEIDNDVLITFDGNGWRQLTPPGDKSTAGIVVCDSSGTIVFAKREPFNEQNLAEVENAAK